MKSTDNENPGARNYSKIWDFQLSRFTHIGADRLIHLTLFLLFLGIKRMWAHLKP